MLRSYALIFAIAISSASPALAGPVDEVIARHRAAMGGAAKGGEVRVTYAYSGQGLTGTVSTRFDSATGAFRTESELGAIHVANGFDGRTPWMRDISGAYTSQTGGDRVPLAVNEAYRNGNLWWHPDRGKAAIAYLGVETIDGRSLAHITVTPRGGAPFDAWFDKGTGLLARIAERQMFFDTRVFYEDYVLRGGTMVASRIVTDGGTGESDYATMRLGALTRGARRPASAYARPTAAPTGVSIEGGKASATLPFRLLNNHIYVEARVNGKGPYTFIVDTGGHTLLSARVVREAKLSPAGASPGAGAGEKTVTSGYAYVRDITIGAVRMREQTAITQDIYDPAVEGVRVDGMVGFELLRRLAVTIDYGRRQLTFTRFDRFKPGAGVAIPFKFYDHLPQVSGRLTGMPVRLNIDTGSRSEIDFTSPFVTAAKLEQRFPGAVTAMTGWGVGGPTLSRVVRLPALAIGPVTIDAPVAGLSQGKAGSFSDSNYEANIGSGLLKRFVTSFDYARQLMYLRPITPLPRDAGTFDRSGMWLNADNGGYKVVYVAPGGAAEAAGLETGDIVTSIDGTPPVAAALSDVRARFRVEPAGTRVQLAVLRSGNRKMIDLVLRDRIAPREAVHAAGSDGTSNPPHPHGG